MKAIVRRKYGEPEVVELAELEPPELTDDGVLVRVHAASVNRLDWYSVKGQPYVARAQFGVFKPRDPRIGVDFAGVAEAVGKDVTDIRPGDDVFGGRSGAFGEYVCVRKAVARKPANLDFEEAATVPVAGVTALQGLRDKARLQPGQRVLINGASGGVGTFAVQIAKAFGADVTAVCSTRNVPLVRSLGADRVVDYTREDFTQFEERYDVLFDVAGSRTLSEYKRVLTPRAIVVMAGAPTGSGLIGPLGHIAKMLLGSISASQKVVSFVAKLNRADLGALRELIEAGKVKPVVERRYDLSETADALRRMAEGHVQSKLVITTA